MTRESLGDLHFMLIICILCFDYVADLTKCQKERKTALGPLGSAPPGRFAPECDDNGKYNKMQCYSATDYCWCVDSLGLEIPGTRKKGRVSCPDKGLRLMLFSCRNVKENKSKGEKWRNIVNGNVQNYSPVHSSCSHPMRSIA